MILYNNRRKVTKPMPLIRQVLEDFWPAVSLLLLFLLLRPTPFLRQLRHHLAQEDVSETPSCFIIYKHTYIPTHSPLCPD